MNLSKAQIGKLLKLPKDYVIIDNALYDPAFPDDLKMTKFLDPDDIDFPSHIPDYHIYPDYAVSKIVNQGIRLLVNLSYPGLEGIPVGMIEHTKLRGQLFPKDTINIFIKKWQERSKVAKFEIAIENQRGILVYESTIYGTVIGKLVQKPG